MTKNTFISEERAIELLKIIEGAEITSAWRGYGSAIFVEFGNLSKRSGAKHEQGEQTLAVEWSWRLEGSDSVLVGSFDENAKMSDFPDMVVGKIVKSVLIFTGLKEIQLELSDSLRLLSFTTTSGDPQWCLRYNDTEHLCVIENKFQIEHAT